MRAPLRFLQLITLSLALVVAPQVSADNKAMIDGNTALALERLRDHFVGAEELLDSAVGVLVFPDVVKMGFGEGGQYGEGALLVEREPVAYYATAGSKFGLQLVGLQWLSAMAPSWESLPAQSLSWRADRPAT